jgi:surface antigen
MKRNRLFWVFISLGLTVCLALCFFFSPLANLAMNKQPGQPLDTLNGVIVYYNGAVNHTAGRNTSADGYNIGLKWQCVEFVKRYYYEYLQHKMPDSYGHAKDFFNKALADGSMNKTRNLIQFTNGSKVAPQPNDLLVFDGHTLNPYGHVAIVSNVLADKIEIVQQNPGPFGKSRVWLGLKNQQGRFFLNDDLALGWLRKQ